MAKKILIMAGGTGGHIFPALAVAQKLVLKKAEVVWLGSKIGMERTLVGEYGYPIFTVSAVGLRGKNFAALVKAPFLLAAAFFQTWMIFRKIHPDVALGMGGFAAGVGGLVAKIFRIPLVIHEQNARAGTTNKILARFSTQIFQAFDGTFAEKLKPRTVGNPMIFRAEPKQKITKPWNILVIGGSLGARILNETIPKLKTPMNIRHQSGKTDFETVRRAYEKSVNDAEVYPFIKNMAAAYAWANLVICRAGAMTISEIMHSGSAAILIPYPFATDDHQMENARILENHQAAILLPQKKLSVENLDIILQNLNNEKIEKMAENAKKLRREKSAEIIAEELLKFE